MTKPGGNSVSKYTLLTICSFLNPLTPKPPDLVFYCVYRQMILLAKGEPKGVNGLIKNFILPPHPLESQACLNSILTTTSGRKH